MQIVIDISEEDYISMKNGHIPFNMLDVVMSGTPLAEPFDLEGLKKDMKALNCGYPFGLDYLLNCLKQRLGITIADKEE